MLDRAKTWFVKESGVVAIEFAMLSLPFLIMLIGMVEISLAYATAFMLEGGTAHAARLVRTGEAQTSGDPEGAFVDQLCDQVSLVIPCADIVYEAVVLDGGFSAAGDAAAQLDADGNLIPSGFDPGGSNDIVLIRAFYRYEFLTPFLGELMTQAGGGTSLALMSTAVIKNEPYDFGG